MRTIYTPSIIEKNDEEELWRTGIIVFDTCALLDFYYMIFDYQIIMADILKYLKERIWLPAHVIEEYEKNRQKAMLKPRIEKYKGKELINNRFVDDLKERINEWEEDYYHPYIKDDKLKKIKSLLNEIEPKIADIKTTISLEYQARKKEIEGIERNDVAK